MSRLRAEQQDSNDDEFLDEPLPRYATADAILELDGEQYDLNALEHPLARRPAGHPARGGLRSQDDDDRARHQAVRLGQRLKALREDERLSQGAAATRAGLRIARVQSLERGERNAHLSEVQALVRALGARLEDVAPDAPEISIKEIGRRAQAADVPRELIQRIADVVGRRGVFRAIERSFGWPRQSLLDGTPVTPRPAFAVRFKSRSTDTRDSSPLLNLARTLAVLLSSHISRPVRPLPEDPHELRRQVLAAHGAVDLEALLRWCWEAGIIVLPLNARGGFSAATWYVDERPVVILKESYAPAAYWLFDLAHELGHLALGHVKESGLVDVDAPTNPDNTDPQERDATAFALALLLGDAEQLIADVRERSAGPNAHKKFKFKVIDVAREASVSDAVLGLVSSHALTDIATENDRWGSSYRLAEDEDTDGRRRVEQALVDHGPLDDLDPLDAALLRAGAFSA